jgi:hypothetical protein
MFRLHRYTLSELADDRLYFEYNNGLRISLFKSHVKWSDIWSV